MPGVIHRTPVKLEESSATITRLETFVRRMERRYECDSEAMRCNVREGRFPETREVGKWLAEYHLLTLLRGQQAAGRETG